jgi:hypothetical protein
MRYFVLDGHKTVEVPERETWNDWMRMHVKERIVNRSRIGRKYHVVTVFTGKSYNESGDPKIFSTAVFSCWYQEPTMVVKWDTWEESEKGHDAIVRRVNLRVAIEEEHEDYPCKG